MARSRYEVVGERKDEDGNRIKNSIVYPTFDPNDSEDIIIRLEKGRRLDKLANQYYNDTDLWWLIAEANNLGRGTLYVEGGQRIRIPMNRSRIFNELRRINENR